MEKILEIKKGQGCATIWLESGDKLRVPAALLREHPVRVGQAIEPLLLKELVIRRGYPHALDSAVRMLSLRSRSENEIRTHLSRAGYPTVCIQRVIERLYAEGLLDDEAFAREWTQSRAHRHGRVRLQRELTSRGVDKEIAREAVSELSEEEQLADAVRLTGRFLSRTRGDFDRKLYQRTLSMLARHGYDADIARRALEIIAKGEDASETPPQWPPRL